MGEEHLKVPSFFQFQPKYNRYFKNSRKLQWLHARLKKKTYCNLVRIKKCSDFINKTIVVHPFCLQYIKCKGSFFVLFFVCFVVAVKRLGTVADLSHI